MALVVRAFPIHCGRADVEQFVAELHAAGETTRRFFEGNRVRREGWFLQYAGKAAYVIAVSDVSDDVEVVAKQFAGTTDEFATWFQSRVLALSGVNQREQPLGPPTEMVFDSTGGGFKLDGTLAVRMYPLRSIAALRELSLELMSREQETRAFYESFQASETWFAQETEAGPYAIAVASLHGDVERNANAYAESRDPFADWFKRRVDDVSGVDPNKTPLGPLSEMVFEFKSAAPPS